LFKYGFLPIHVRSVPNGYPFLIRFGYNSVTDPKFVIRSVIGNRIDFEINSVIGYVSVIYAKHFFNVLKAKLKLARRQNSLIGKAIIVC